MGRLKAPAASPAHCYACSRMVSICSCYCLLRLSSEADGLRYASDDNSTLLTGQLWLGTKDYSPRPRTLAPLRAWPVVSRSNPARSRLGFDPDCHGTCLKTRCTTLVPMPSFLPILRMPSPLALHSSIRASTEGLTPRRPSVVPFALARASPALTRSLIIPRSNSANTPSI